MCILGVSMSVVLLCMVMMGSEVCVDRKLRMGVMVGVCELFLKMMLCMCSFDSRL